MRDFTYLCIKRNGISAHVGYFNFVEVIRDTYVNKIVTKLMRSRPMRS